VTIIWSETAISDFSEILEFRRRYSVDAATRISLAIADRLDLLDGHPGQGRRIPEIGNELLREVIVGQYRIWYRVRGDDLELIAILHGARDTR
jgi:toxin ParE1/3/4